MDELGRFLLETASRLDVWSILDIVLVAAIIYGTFSLFRGTTAATVLYGLAFLGLALLVVSAIPQLAVLNWLLRAVMPFLAFVLLVMFQPELRRAMERIGRVRALLYPALGGAANPALARPLDDVVKACRRLAERKAGALIVFERATGLQDYVESGVAVDGQVSTELLLTIFFPNSPLHDGAVIIRGSRVAAAGCLLPLSPNTGAELFGTRHRAAIGITEHTDALAIVVSEETGVISLANNGRLVRHLDESRLRRVLDILLRPSGYDSLFPWAPKGPAGGSGAKQGV